MSRAKLDTATARNMVDSWLKARGWTSDWPRSSKHVLITAGETRRVTLGARCVVFEVGGRGAWRKDRRMHPEDFAQLTLVSFASTLPVEGRCGDVARPTVTPLTTPDGFCPYTGRLTPKGCDCLIHRELIQ